MSFSSSAETSPGAFPRRHQRAQEEPEVELELVRGGASFVFEGWAGVSVEEEAVVGEVGSGSDSVEEEVGLDVWDWLKLGVEGEVGIVSKGREETSEGGWRDCR